jgi:SPX domain protein involved in polyphosphate accumulation
MEDYESTYFKYMIQEWKNNYIDYSDLLKFINDNINKVAILPSNEKDNIISNQENEPNQNEIIKLFKSKLNKELKKFYIFFIQQERELYLSINTRLHIKKKYNTFNNSEI